MIHRILFFKVVFIISWLTFLGCAGSSNVTEPSTVKKTPTVVKPSIDDQKIIDMGIIKAKELGLRPFPMIGEEKSGNFTVIPPAQITYDMQGNSITTSDDLYINATKGNIKLKGLTIKRGQYAREIDYKLQIVE